jgi:hypothetical protein
LNRNIYAGKAAGKQLSSYVRAVEAALAAAPLDAFIKGPVPFPVPSAVLMEAIP